MRTRRTPRWTTSDGSRFGLLACVEALNPEKLSKRNWNELERLSRKRSAIYWSREPIELKRKRRKSKRFVDYIGLEFLSVLSKSKAPSHA